MQNETKLITKSGQRGHKGRLDFQIHQKFNHDILDWLNKSKIPSHYGFPLANPQSVSIVDFVPDENIMNDL
jgi:hypothetical protein